MKMYKTIATNLSANISILECEGTVAVHHPHQLCQKCEAKRRISLTSRSRRSGCVLGIIKFGSQFQEQDGKSTNYKSVFF